MKNLTMILGMILIIIGSSGCGKRTVYVPMYLELEPRPVLPKITGQELSCLSESTYKNLYDREVLLKNHVEVLETTIKSTW